MAAQAQWTLFPELDEPTAEVAATKALAQAETALTTFRTLADIAEQNMEVIAQLVDRLKKVQAED